MHSWPAIPLCVNPVASGDAVPALTGDDDPPSRVVLVLTRKRED